jgi:hypothetical protein
MNETNELIARIESLEKKNRRLVRIGGAAILALGSLGAMSLRSACDTVSAERFVLLDTQGHQRALLSAYDTGGVPQLVLYDKKGRAAATLGIGKTGAYLALADADAQKTVRYEVESGTATGPSTGENAPKREAESKGTGPIMAGEGTR